MRNVLFGLCLILSSCAFNPLKTSVEAENKRIEMGGLKLGMNQNQVRQIMRAPYKRECFIYNHEEYEVWYYLTKGPFLGQSQYIDRNFTPLIFKNDALYGWGWRLYNEEFDVLHIKKRNLEIDEEKIKKDHIKSPSEHRIYSPYENRKMEEALEEKDKIKEFDQNKKDALSNEQKKLKKSACKEADCSDEKSQDPKSKTDEKSKSPCSKPNNLENSPYKVWD